MPVIENGDKGTDCSIEKAIRITSNRSYVPQVILLDQDVLKNKTRKELHLAGFEIIESKPCLEAELLRLLVLLKKVSNRVINKFTTSEQFKKKFHNFLNNRKKQIKISELRRIYHGKNELQELSKTSEWLKKIISYMTM
jgi:pyruvate/2-oxoacid:ferredoxin oxidoreductase beta subunit